MRRPVAFWPCWRDRASAPISRGPAGVIADAGRGLRVGRAACTIVVVAVALITIGSPARAAAVRGLPGVPTTAGPPPVRGPVLWTAPVGVDVNPIDGLACPASQLCVAVDQAGGVLWSTDPAGGSRAWHRVDVDDDVALTGLSCPSTSLCVATDALGDVVSSTDPAGGAWSVAMVDRNLTTRNTDTGGGPLLRGISCPSTSLCVATDAVGDALVSTDPTGGAVAWTAIHADADTTGGCSGTGLACQPPLVGVACPSTSLCAAVDFSGDILATGAPASPTPWTTVATAAGGPGSLWGISCPTVSFCAAVDGPGQRVVTFDPSVPASVLTHALPDAVDGIWCASSSLCLATAQTGGGISGLLGSSNPSAAHPTWALSSPGGVDAISCPSPSACLAADDEGNVTAGETTSAMGSTLSSQLLSRRRLPTRARLTRSGVDPLRFTSSIVGLVTLVWSQAGPAGTVTLASATHQFTKPGTGALVLRLTGNGRQILLGRARRVTLTATATYLAGNGALRRRRRLTFVRPAPRAPRHKPSKRKRPS